MSGVSSTTGTITKSTNAYANGVLSGTGWTGTITYAFPTSASDYSYTYESSNGFAAITNGMQSAALFALELSDGKDANDGFSLEGFTNANIEAGSASSSTIRIAQSSVPSTAYAYMPTTAAQGGDVWFGTRYDYTAPEAGNYGWHTMLHELGHALGLKHTHEKSGSFGLMAAALDSVEFSVMSYRAYAGAKLTGYTYSTWSAPQTYMMADIAALQHMYGADYTTNSGDTTYSWTPDSGDTKVNGDVAINAGGTMIFATIWDGDGVDTYDLSAYATNLTLNLAPGLSSAFSSAQLASLGANHFARGNIYNAQLFGGDTHSLIENAVGGSGNDIINGNVADNGLTGGEGNDKLYGQVGNDTLSGNGGTDIIDGGVGNDTINGGDGADTIIGGAGDDTVDGGDGANIITDLLGNDTITGGADIDIIKSGAGDDVINGGGGADLLYGGVGNDTINGGDGADRMWGETGNSILNGDAGADTIYGNVGMDTISGGDDADLILSSTGNDTVDGGGGDDKILGGVGNDTLTGGADNDMVYGEAGTNVLYGNGGNDTLYGGIMVDTISGGLGDDFILASTGNDTINGEAGADTISGGVGTDMISGGDGADIFVFESVAFLARDTISDFDYTTDFIKFGVAAMKTILVSGARQVGDNTVVTFSAATSLTLLHFDVANIDDINFAL